MSIYSHFWPFDGRLRRPAEGRNIHTSCATLDGLSSVRFRCSRGLHAPLAVIYASSWSERGRRGCPEPLTLHLGIDATEFQRQLVAVLMACPLFAPVGLLV